MKATVNPMTHFFQLGLVASMATPLARFPLGLRSGENKIRRHGNTTMYSPKHTLERTFFAFSLRLCLLWRLDISDSLSEELSLLQRRDQLEDV